MSKYKPNLKKLYKKLLRDINSLYDAQGGELYVRLDKLEYYLEDEYESKAGRPESFCLTGQYGRQSIYHAATFPDDIEVQKFYKDFELTWFPGESLEHVSGRFIQLMEGKEEDE